MTSPDPITATRAGRRRRRRRIAGALTALTLAASGLAAWPAQAAATGKITGTVSARTADGTARTVTGGYIYLYKKSADGSYYDSVDSDPSTPSTNGFSFSGKTFTLSGLQPGQYTFEMADADDAQGTAYQREYYNNAGTLQSAQALTVGSGTTTAKPMVVEPAGQVTGRVTDAAGKPLANASVSFEYAQGSGQFVQTDSQGRYTSTTAFGGGLVRGAVKVTAYKSGSWGSDAVEDRDYISEYWKNAATYAAATPVAVTPGKTATNIDFTLDLAPRIRLTAKDADGKPIANAPVGIYVYRDGAWGPIQSGPNLTDSAGVYRRTVRVGEKFKFFIAPPKGVPGVKEWFDNVSSAGAAKVVTATRTGQVVNVPIQLNR